eukprot:8281732-Lingulodinium_polyedra.AAC.1
MQQQRASEGRAEVANAFHSEDRLGGGSAAGPGRRKPDDASGSAEGRFPASLPAGTSPSRKRCRP